MKKSYLSITILVIVILASLNSCNNSSSFSKRKYRKGVFKEYSTNIKQAKYVNDTLFLKQNGKLSEQYSAQTNALFEDSLQKKPADSCKLKYVEFRKRLNNRSTRSGKKRLHKKWLRDSLQRTADFNQLSKSEQKKEIRKQYSIERKNEIFIFKKNKKKHQDSLRRAYPDLSNKEFRREIKKNNQTKITKASRIFGIISFVLLLLILTLTITFLIIELFAIILAALIFLLIVFFTSLILLILNKSESKHNPNYSHEEVKEHKISRAYLIIAIGICLYLVLFFMIILLFKYNYHDSFGG